MKIWIPICLALFLGAGCTTAIIVAKEKAQEEAAKIADQALDIGIWNTCFASSIGAIKRRFGDSPATAEMYARFCDVEPGLIGG